MVEREAVGMGGCELREGGAQGPGCGIEPPPHTTPLLSQALYIPIRTALATSLAAPSLHPLTPTPPIPIPPDIPHHPISSPSTCASDSPLALHRFPPAKHDTHCTMSPNLSLTYHPCTIPYQGP